MRAVAIILVLIAHYFQPNTIIEFIRNIPFNYGVNLFFVLSGFLITNGLLVDKTNLSFRQAIGSFFKKRLLRIFPIYYGFIIVLLLWNYEAIANQLPYLLTFSYNFYLNEINLTDNYHIIHFWSLAVEEQFYLFWPFLILLLKQKHIKTVLLVLVIVSLEYKFYLHFFTDEWVRNMYGLVPNMYHLAIGGLIAVYSNNAKLISHLGKGFLVLISIALAIIMIALGHFYHFDFVKSIFSPFFSTIAFGMIVIYFLNPNRTFVKKMFRFQPMIFIGKISYGIYLFHLFIPKLIDKIPKIESLFINNTAQFLVYSTATIIVATLSWYLIEKPILKLKRK